MNNQYSLKISALKHVGNASVNFKPDHLPSGKTPGKMFLVGEFHIPHPWGYKNNLKPTPGAFSSIIHNTT